jgi:hypothetical protein
MVNIPFNHPERVLPSGEERMFDTAEQTGIFRNNQKQLRMPGWIGRLHSGEARHAICTAWIILILDACYSISAAQHETEFINLFFALFSNR